METPKPNPKQQRALELQAQNQAMIHKLNANGGQVGNLMQTRHEQFIGFLVKVGVLTADQLDDFNIEWEEFVNTELSNVMDEVLKQIRQQQIMQGVAPPPNGRMPKGGLLGPSGLPL